MGLKNQQFDSFEDWLGNATNWLTHHPLYMNTQHPTINGDKGWRGHHFTAICFDTLGRILRSGGDFRRAQEENCFPVRWVWPDQIPDLILNWTANDYIGLWSMDSEEKKKYNRRKVGEYTEALQNQPEFQG